MRTQAHDLKKRLCPPTLRKHCLWGAIPKWNVPGLEQTFTSASPAGHVKKQDVLDYIRSDYTDYPFPTMQVVWRSDYKEHPFSTNEVVFSEAP
ncbi:hypothetical protein AVEN_208987-1 [Araneus ventricosus]|uniref:Uncharacterized protein n=1 Tax=Araneus ventricosus TaxID=182803 RepID=A0A4Y2CSP7_ARAVE|nr:hypothetical protein AVEN_208987-1 [Araneus ventricosus]